MDDKKRRMFVLNNMHAQRNCRFLNRNHFAQIGTHAWEQTVPRANKKEHFVQNGTINGNICSSNE